MSSIFNAVGGEARMRVRWRYARVEENEGFTKMWRFGRESSYFALPSEGDAQNHVHKKPLNV